MMKTCLVFEGPEFALDGQALLAFLNMTYNLGIDVKGLREVYDLFCDFRTDVDLHTVAHIENLVHFLPIGT